MRIPDPRPDGRASDSLVGCGGLSEHFHVDDVDVAVLELDRPGFFEVEKARLTATRFAPIMVPSCS